MENSVEANEASSWRAILLTLVIAQHAAVTQVGSSLARKVNAIPHWASSRETVAF